MSHCSASLRWFRACIAYLARRALSPFFLPRKTEVPPIRPWGKLALAGELTVHGLEPGRGVLVAGIVCKRTTDAARLSLHRRCLGVPQRSPRPILRTAGLAARSEGERSATMETTRGERSRREALRLCVGCHALRFSGSSVRPAEARSAQTLQPIRTCALVMLGFASTRASNFLQCPEVVRDLSACGLTSLYSQ